MARPPKGKPLTLRPIRLDDDVWAECQRLGKEHGTINEGLRTKLIASNTITRTTELIEELRRSESKGRGKASTQTWKRGPRPKGDKSR